ncbi:MAG: flavodoxin family protein [Candidatus Hodarchaeota archaeon]
MKTLTLHGSPRKNGSSDTLVEYFIKGLRISGNNEIQQFYTNDLNIRPCQGCLACNSKLPHYCKIEDDMQEIYSSFIEANIVVFATPMYWGYMTAQLKTIVDRMEAIASKKYFQGKNFVVILTYHYHYESTAAFFKRIIDYFGGTLHTIIYHSLDKNSDEDVHVSNCKEKLEEAYNLGKTLGKQ